MEIVYETKSPKDFTIKDVRLNEVFNFPKSDIKTVYRIVGTYNNNGRIRYRYVSLQSGSIYEAFDTGKPVIIYKVTRMTIRHKKFCNDRF